MDGVPFLRCRKKTHLSLSTCTTRPLPSSVMDEEEPPANSLGLTSVDQPLLLAQVGHWCWANSSKFFSTDSNDERGTLPAAAADSSGVTARLRMDGDAGSDTLTDLLASSVSSLSPNGQQQGELNEINKDLNDKCQSNVPVNAFK